MTYSSTLDCQDDDTQGQHTRREDTTRRGHCYSCAHGDTVLYPIAQVEFEVAGRTIMVEAAVSTTLQTAVLLVMDVPELPEIILPKQTFEKYT